jgi:hypothetical protein
MPQYNWKDISTKSLRSYARELQRAAARIQDIADAMEEDGIKELTAHNTTIGVRGVDFVGKYCEALRQAHLRYRQERGDFDT